MKETIYRCDICQAESDPDQMLHTDDGIDVCVSCLEKLVKQHFKNKKVEEAVEKGANPDDDKIDYKAAQALRNAGWTIKDIAKELKCSVGSIYNNTHPAVEKKKKPLEFTDDDIKRLEGKP